MQAARKATLLFLVLTLALTGCAAPGNGLTVFAAASLTDVLQSLGSDFSEATGIPVRFSFGGSVTLAHQLAKGAPADLFVAAGAVPMDGLEAQGLLVDGTRRILLTNSLVLATRSDGPELGQPRDLLSDHVTRVAIADPALAPAGQYAQAALRSLGLWEELQPRLVLGLDVRTSLAYVRRGDADVAVVYTTDAEREGFRTLLMLPSDAYPRVQYPIAVLRSSPRHTAALEFIAFLVSQSSQDFFEAHGWSSPTERARLPPNPRLLHLGPRGSRIVARRANQSPDPFSAKGTPPHLHAGCVARKETRADTSRVACAAPLPSGGRSGHSHRVSHRAGRGLGPG